MSREIKESDWKLFRQLHSVALERFCQRILSEVEGISNDNEKSFHQRYSDVFDTIDGRNQEIAHAFDNPRRSAALMQLATIRSRGLLTDDEFQQFSEETRELIEVLLGNRRA